jgi:hypothetical protein
MAFEKQKCIQLMERKAAVVATHGIDSSKYFNKRDKEAILRWEDDEAARVWEELRYFIDRDECGLTNELCPFCILTETECKRCSYCAIHGDCYKPNSDFQYILARLDVDEVFSNEWFREVYREIELYYALRCDILESLLEDRDFAVVLDGNRGIYLPQQLWRMLDEPRDYSDLFHPQNEDYWEDFDSLLTDINHVLSYKNIVLFQNESGDLCLKRQKEDDNEETL